MDISWSMSGLHLTNYTEDNVLNNSRSHSDDALIGALALLVPNTSLFISSQIQYLALIHKFEGYEVIRKRFGDFRNRSTKNLDQSCQKF